MDADMLMRLVDSIHREKNIDQEIVFRAIEAALISAAKRYYGEDAEIEFRIDRQAGVITGSCNGEPLDYAETIGRIGAQTAKQVIIQKVREAERDAIHDEFKDQEGDLVSGLVTRNEGGVTTVQLGAIEAILPRSEQIPGETYHVNERVRAIIHEVKKQGSRVKVVLSRKSPYLVRRLFEQEIPEIAEGVIQVRAMAREPGYRSKVAVSSADQRVDCVGACVGVRGNRIKNIVDELAGERIDIVRWDDNPQVLITNALQPAKVDEVILCQMMGRAIVMVADDQLSLAIGRRGQNVRLASKLCGWDIEIMTQEELEEQIERAVIGFSALDGVDEELANRLVGEGFLSYDDLSVIEPEALMEMGGLTEEQVDHIVMQAESKAAEAEAVAAEQRRRQRESAAAAPPASEASASDASAAAPAIVDANASPEGVPSPEEIASGDAPESESVAAEGDAPTESTPPVDADAQANAVAEDAETQS